MSGQGSQGHPAEKEEREWRLKDCTMEIASMGKKDPKDEFMTIDLVFKMDDEPVPKVVGKLTMKAINKPGHSSAKLSKVMFGSPEIIFEVVLTNFPFYTFLIRLKIAELAIASYS